MAIGRPVGSKNRTAKEMELDLKIKKAKMQVKILEQKKKDQAVARKISAKKAVSK